MALLFCDSFDHYTAQADFLKRGWIGSGTYNILASSGRYGTNAARLSNGGVISRAISQKATLVCGVAINMDSIYATGTRPIIRFSDGATNQCELNVSQAYYLWVSRNGSSLAVGNIALAVGMWHFIEFKVTIDNSGSYAVRVNGINYLSGSGDTQASTTNAWANTLILNGMSSQDTLFDDLYLCDNSGGINDDFLGDCRVQALFPNGNGVNTAWTASAGDDYACVDESTPNDTDYISSSVAGQKTTVVFPDLTGTMSVKAVQTSLLALKDNAGSRNIREICRSNGSDYTGATQAVGDSYYTYREVRDKDPNTDAAWDMAGVNAAEFGVELVS